jgi:hypothetical protein
MSKHPVIAGIGLLLLLFTLGIVLDAAGIVSFGRQQAIAATKGVIAKTVNADNIIQQYEDFKRLASSYANLTSQIDTAAKKVADFKSEQPTAFNGDKVDASKLSKDDKERYNFLKDNLNAVEVQRDNIASDYNGRVMMMNRNIFRNTFVDKYYLPDHLPLNGELSSGQYAIPDLSFTRR